MSEIIITTNYIYLLQEREFIKSKENIYKVGMTKKENHIRFNQYPKGSVLLFQMICNNCKSIEKQIIKLFIEKFENRKDIGSEYFEGEYKSMIDIIYLTIKNEENIDEDVVDANQDYIEEDNIEEETLSTYEITTYEEWIKSNKLGNVNNISKVIITNEKRKEGFLKFERQLWRKLYDTNNLEFEDEENLLGYIQNFQSDYLLKNKTTNEFISYYDYLKLDNTEQNKYESKNCNIKYNVEKILEDTIKKCIVKKYDLYNLNYCEYAFSIFRINNNSSSVSYVIYNSEKVTFTPVDELISDKILTEDCVGNRSFFIKNIINISIVDDILNSLITNDIKIQYKKLVYNLIVKQEEKQIIFYDYNEGLLTTWIKDLLYSIRSCSYKIYALSYEYYDDKIAFKKLLKIHNCRCIIIREIKWITIEQQIKDFHKLGFRNIIVNQNDKKNSMYDIVNYRKYLHDNKEIIMKYIKEENNYEPTSWESEIQHNDSIFYSQRLLLTNFLKWCCVK